MTHTCPMCQREFRSPTGLIKHTESSSACFGANPPEAVHHGVSKWEASRNQHHAFTGAGSSSFMGNIEITSDAYNDYTGMWDCALCSKSFHRQHDLQRHINSGTHDSKENYTCRECGKGFSRMSALSDHARQKHGHSTTARLSNVLSHDVSNLGTLMLTDGSEARTEATLRFDGGCRPNPGYGGCGFVLQDTISGWALAKESVTVDAYPATNNMAEYQGLISGLERALAQGVRRLRVEGDSQLVINQMKGVYAVNSNQLQPYYSRAKDAESKFQVVQYQHIDRSENWEADGLASHAVTEREKEGAGYGGYNSGGYDGGYNSGGYDDVGFSGYYE